MTAWILYLLVGLRFSSLLLRPIHHDEAVNAWFVDRIWELGYYKYDPTNYHGPTLFYLGFLARLILGDDLWALRFVPVVGSCLAIGLLYFYRKYIGKIAVWSALAVATSTGYFYYSRFFFHESLLVLSLVIVNLGFVQIFNKELRGWGLVWVGGLLAFATKETAALHAASVFGALAALGLSNEGRQLWRTQVQSIKWDKMIKPIFLGLLCFCILFTGFFYNSKGPLDVFRAFTPWLNTGVGGNGHEKVWYYWFELLKTYEWVFLIGFLGCIVALFRSKNLLIKFLSLEALLTLIAYSVVPYKTPWCIPSVVWLSSIGFGYLICELGERRRLISFSIGLALLMQSSYSLYEFNFKRYAAINEPYVYVQSVQEYGDILVALEMAAQKFPRFQTELIESQLASQWPLPWVLRFFTNVRWTLNTENPEGKIIIVDKDKIGNTLARLPSSYYLKEMIIRGGVGESFILIEKTLAANYQLESLTKNWEEVGGQR